MYLISFYAPVEQVEAIKMAMFIAGAGKMGEYSCCAWQTLGEGQFMPLENSSAFVGQKFQIEKVSEFKVEMVCDPQCIQKVIAALKEAHPYEEPAYHILKMEQPIV